MSSGKQSIQVLEHLQSFIGSFSDVVESLIKRAKARGKSTEDLEHLQSFIGSFPDVVEWIFSQTGTPEHEGEGGGSSPALEEGG